MNIREKTEKWEKDNLSPYATLSCDSKGRNTPEKSCKVRTEFQKDRDKILHSLSFRLLKHKTQVYLSTTGEDFRTRLTHTQEVASVARAIAKALSLNQDLVEAISLGHDLGHTPFGHAGEKSLNELAPFEFKHAEQSVRVVTKIEDNGHGLNLTREVIEGIEGHTKGEKSLYAVYNANLNGTGRPATLEGEVVQFSDWIAYINHDVDDAFNMGLIKKDDLPESTIKYLGHNFQQRVLTMMKSVISSSYGKNHIHMEEKVMRATDELRKFLFNNIYKLQEIEVKEDTAYGVIRKLYTYFLKNYNEVLKEMTFLNEQDIPRGTCDYIAFLTDLKAQEIYNKI